MSASMISIPSRFDTTSTKGKEGKPAYEINFHPMYREQLGVPEKGDRTIIFLITGRRYLGMFSHRKSDKYDRVYTRSALTPLDSYEPPHIYRGEHTIGTILHERHGLQAPDNLELRLTEILETSGATLLVEVIHAKLASPTPPPSYTPTTSDLPPGNTGAGFGDAETNALVEKAAVDFVTKQYQGAGWVVTSREQTKNIGYDLECKKGNKVRHVEVKGVSGERDEFIITANEVASARGDPLFLLAIVTTARSCSPQLTEYTGAEMLTQFDLKPIAFRTAAKKQPST